MRLRLDVLIAYHPAQAKVCHLSIAWSWSGHAAARGLTQMPAASSVSVTLHVYILESSGVGVRSASSTLLGVRSLCRMFLHRHSSPQSISAARAASHQNVGAKLHDSAVG